MELKVALGAKLLTPARADRLKEAIKHGKLHVGTDFALAKLDACTAAEPAVAGKLAASALDKAAQKSITLAAPLIAALAAIKKGAAAGA
jgi:hypothetical protein